MLYFLITILYELYNIMGMVLSFQASINLFSIRIIEIAIFFFSSIVKILQGTIQTELCIDYLFNWEFVIREHSI